MTPDQLKVLRLARGRLKKAERDLAQALTDIFPVGSIVRWKRGRGIQTGTVTRSGSGVFDSLAASNHATGKEVRFGSYEIIQAAKGGDA